MQTTRINYKNLVRQLLPAHKRQPVRLWWLRGLVAPLGTLFAEFDKWRSDTRMIVNVNSQVAVFEGYLRKKYGEPVAIRVVTYDDGLARVSLRAEGDTLRLRTGLRDETAREAMPLRGEIRELFGDADFIVYIPVGVDIDLIRAEIERFKQALVQYKIIQE
ncbi:hypothetical protein [Rikenella microfusus]|uniref:Uncharacterized protein n=1 Tax=Rikenella microfusus TaxID=28139 RepID=A0A379MSU4_9BACT|nr:hypothetical protein [Rikenella microfusus]SUE33682.1 Uncharacterised protein [Rikenella microfusus]